MFDKKVLKDPLTGQIYRLCDDGLVEVTDPETGQSGKFDQHGAWQSGALRYANAQLAGWMGRIKT